MGVTGGEGIALMARAKMLREGGALAGAESWEEKSNPPGWPTPNESVPRGGAEAGVVGVIGSGSSTSVGPATCEREVSRLLRPKISGKDDLRVRLAVEAFERLELAEDDGVDGEVTLVVGEMGELPMLATDPLRVMPMCLISSSSNLINGAGRRAKPEVLFLLDLWSCQESSPASRST